jgi:hypothetical protein
VALLKRSRSPSPDADSEPQPLPARALPEALWEDHLLPLLTCKDAARLGRTCKALRGVVREYFYDVGTVKVEQLQATLTTFPRTRTVQLRGSRAEGGREDKEALVEWLREGGRGRHLVTVWCPDETALINLVHTALRQGALPSLTFVSASLEHETQRESLTRGLLGGMHEMVLNINTKLEDDEVEAQLEALGLVRQLPALTKLEVQAFGRGDRVEWPPFIPPYLRALCIDGQDGLCLSALPGMLGASGARLDRLEVIIPSDFRAIGDALAGPPPGPGPAMLLAHAQGLPSVASSSFVHVPKTT